MKKNLVPLFAIAFVVAVASTAVFYGLVAGRISNAAEASNALSVVVATRDLPRGTTISPADVKEVHWTTAELPPGAYVSAAQVKGLTTVRAVYASDPITDTRVASAKTGGGLGIPSGMRAISVQVGDSSGVLALLRPGHRVDVQAVYHAGNPNEAELRTVLQNIEVLRVHSTPEPSPGKPSLPVVTFLTTPAEAESVGLADSIARIRVVLRNPLDQDKTVGSTVSVASIRRNRPSTSPSLPAPAPKLAIETQGAACVPQLTNLNSPAVPVIK